LLEDTAAVRQRLLGCAHPVVLASQVNLARGYWSQGDKTAAISVLEGSLAAYQATLGPGHPDTLAVTNLLHSWRTLNKRRWRKSRTARPSRPSRRTRAT
jgi:tetratricopeptide repeat protein